jgi:hypothetical protein
MHHAVLLACHLAAIAYKNNTSNLANHMHLYQTQV